MNSVQPWMYSEIKCNFCNRLHKKEDDKNDGTFHLQIIISVDELVNITYKTTIKWTRIEENGGSSIFRR